MRQREHGKLQLKKHSALSGAITTIQTQTKLNLLEPTFPIWAKK